MTLLGGLFSRKNKSKQRVGAATSGLPPPAELELNLPSPTISYVTPDKHVPSVPNGKNCLHPDSARDVHPNFNGHQSSPETMQSPPPSSKLRLPFGRKKIAKMGPSELNSTMEEEPYLSRSPMPSYFGRMSTSSAASDASTATDVRRLRPPPSKSAIFAAYGDPHSALSTRSLPNEGYHTRSELSTPPHPPPVPTKRPSLFPWNKSSKNVSIPLKNEQSLSSLGHTGEGGESSFNLKSFRHVGQPSSPTRSNASNVSLSTPIPRPHGESVPSDSSQRISVAAFREAQARRSMAGSPSPSTARSPSPLPNSPFLSNEANRGRSSPLPTRSSPRIAHSSASHSNLQHHRKSGMSFAATSLDASDSEESETSSEHEESDDDRTYTLRASGKQGAGWPPTSAARLELGKTRAKSDLGHGLSSYPSPLSRDGPSPRPAPKSHLGHESVSLDQPQSSASYLARPTLGSSPNSADLPRSQSGMSQQAGGLRPRASASTSALTPSAAAKRASVIATANAANEAEDALMQYKRASRHIRDSSIHSNPAEPPSMMPGKRASTHLGHGGFSAQQQIASDSDDSDSDNAPLATLLNPRRPGSSMSSYSNGNVSAKSGGGPSHKPLIDIKELTGGTSVANKSGTAPTIASAAKSVDGFTPGRTLLNSSSPVARAAMASPRSMSPLREVTSKVAPFEFVSPPPTPAQRVVKTMGLPPRSATTPLLSTSSLTTDEKDLSPERERKRDALTDRLTKAVKMTVGSPPTDAETSRSLSSPHTPMSDINAGNTPSPMMRGRATSPSPLSNARQQTTSPASLSRDPKPDTSQFTSPMATRRMSLTPAEAPSTSNLTIKPKQHIPKPTTPDASLADLLGGGIALISRNGESSTSESEETSESSDESDDNYGYQSLSRKADPAVKVAATPDQAPKKNVEEPKESETITPIPIKQRTPVPSFSVTSRPQFPRRLDGLLNESAAGSASGSSSTGSVAGSKSPDMSQSSSSLSVSTQGRRRSSTLMPPPTTSSTLLSSSHPVPSVSSPSGARSNLASTSPGPPTGQITTDRTSALRAVGATIAMQPQPRQRSSTLLPIMPTTSSPTGTPPPSMPSRPFAARRDSPASSTGDSSSGRAPLTPRDGSDIGLRGKQKVNVDADQYSGGASGLGINGKGKPKHMQRRSVSFEDDLKDLGDYRPNRNSREVLSRNSNDTAGALRRKPDDQLEIRRKERRREEAKAAIELGNVVNGRGPIIDDDDDELPMTQLNQRMSAMNPMMMNPMVMQQQGYGGQPNSLSPGTWGMNPNMNVNMAMQQAASSGMLSPAQFMVGPPPSDTNFLAAHQQAMMIAKQAYQMAVAQQAMAAAADEWERSSNMGGFGGSVYGGSSGPPSMLPSYGMMGGMPMGGMNGMNGMAMMGGGNNWSTGSAIFPSSRPMYGGNISSSRSEYGGGMSGGPAQNWSSSRSSYAEYGPGVKDRRGRPAEKERDSTYAPPVPPMPNPSGRNTPRVRTTSHPASPGRSSGILRKAPPPSSWKPGF